MRNSAEQPAAPVARRGRSARSFREGGTLSWIFDIAVVDHLAVAIELEHFVYDPPRFDETPKAVAARRAAFHALAGKLCTRGLKLEDVGCYYHRAVQR